MYKLLHIYFIGTAIPEDIPNFYVPLYLVFFIYKL